MKFHIVLTERNADIIAFKNFVPRGEFNKCVIMILRRAVAGKPIEKVVYFDIDYLAPKTHTKIDLPDDLARQCYDKLKFKKDSFTTGVKKEIRKYITRNRKDPRRRYVEIDVLKMIIQTTKEAMRDTREQYADHPERNKCVLNEYQNILGVLTGLLAREKEVFPLLFDLFSGKQTARVIIENTAESD